MDSAQKELAATALLDNELKEQKRDRLHGLLQDLVTAQISLARDNTDEGPSADKSKLVEFMIGDGKDEDINEQSIKKEGEKDEENEEEGKKNGYEEEKEKKEEKMQELFEEEKDGKDMKDDRREDERENDVLDEEIKNKKELKKRMFDDYDEEIEEDGEDKMSEKWWAIFGILRSIFIMIIVGVFAFCIAQNDEMRWLKDILTKFIPVVDIRYFGIPPI